MKKLKDFLCVFLIFTFTFLILQVDSILASEKQELVSLDYKNAELSSVLRSLSYSYNLNLVATKNLKGNVTVSLRDITIEEALDAILRVNGYAFTKKGSIIYITPGLGVENINMTTVSIPIKYLNASEASLLLENTISSRGEIRINEATNSLVVTDIAESLQNLKNVLEEIDVLPIQVLIEAKIIDISEEDLQNLGVTYTVDVQPKSNPGEQFAGGGDLAGPSATLDGGEFQLTAFTFKDIASATATIDALLEDNKADVLASPSIATLNGQEARIIIGERYPYKESTQTTTGTTETTKFVDIGTTLRVTPRVSPDGWITMVVHPEVSTLKEQLDDGPRITTREADATIRVKDGQTIVIGGLIKREETNKKGKIPILGYIPIIGALFTNFSSEATSSELVVFITPHIIRSPEEQTSLVSSEEKNDYVDIKTRGEHVMVTNLWEEASNLERNRGIVSKRKDKDSRMSTALEIYQELASLYPENEKADDSLYRAGRIAYKYFQDLELAKKLFSQLAERYPKSSFRAKSKSWVNYITKKLDIIRKREERRRRVRLPKPKKNKLFPLRFK